MEIGKIKAEVSKLAKTKGIDVQNISKYFEKIDECGIIRV